MKFFLSVLVVNFLLLPAIAQKLTKISLLNNGDFDRITFDLDEAVVLHISKDGKIAKWGVDIYKGRDDNYNDRLEEFTGKTGYFGPTDDSAYRGKLKFIGRTYFTYYASYEDDLLKGKIKSIGNNSINYYRAYENEAYRGNIKNVGSLNFSWYGTQDNEGFRGKLKTAGTSSLTYYTSFDDKAFRGKIKSIDRATYTYYSSFDRAEYRGTFKTGAQTVIANGIKYYIRW